MHARHACTCYWQIIIEYTILLNDNFQVDCPQIQSFVGQIGQNYNFKFHPSMTVCPTKDWIYPQCTWKLSFSNNNYYYLACTKRCCHTHTKKKYVTNNTQGCSQWPIKLDSINMLYELVLRKTRCSLDEKCVVFAAEILTIWPNNVKHETEHSQGFFRHIMQHTCGTRSHAALQEDWVLDGHLALLPVKAGQQDQRALATQD